MRRLMILVLVLGWVAQAHAQGSLTIPNTFSGGALGPLGRLDANWAAIATYVNARELTLGTLANRPAAGVRGRLYTATDQNSGTTYYDNGTTWIQIAAGATIAPQLNIVDFNAKGNTQTVLDGAITNGQTTLTSATGSFGVGDIGKNVTVAGAGAAGALLSTTITGFSSPTTVTLGASAGSTVTGARIRWGNDDTPAFNAALAALNTAIGGVLVLPKATYWIQTQMSAIPNQVTIRGTGSTSSVLYCNHDADCIRTASPVNGSTAIFNVYQDFGLLTDRTTHTGGGFADTAGSFLIFERLQISGPFKYSMILDQSEVVRVGPMVDFEMGTTNTLCGIWLVSGSERTAGASAYFTNGIAIVGNQFNTGGTVAFGLCDDGGVNHVIRDNNFNAGSAAGWFSGVRGLTLSNNASENHANQPFTFDKVTGQGAITKRPVSGGLVSGNVVADTAAYHYVLNAVDSVPFVGNISSGYATTMFNTGSAVANTISGNSKVIRDSNRTAGGFLTASLNVATLNTITQQMQTYVASSHAGGAQTVTPATMGMTATSAALPESFAVGDVLFVENNDETNQEFVTVTATAGTTFTATFGSSKSANWLVYGMTRNQKFLGLAIGAPTGGGKGDGTINIATADGFQVNGTALKSISETLSNKTLASPVISGTTSGTYTLGGAATIASSTVGPHVIGGASSTNANLYLTGAFSGGAQGAFGSYNDVALSPAASQPGYGEWVTPTINKASSGTHADFSSVIISPPTIGAGASTLTNASTLKILAAPSVGTNQRALWVAAGGIAVGAATTDQGTGTINLSATSPIYVTGNPLFSTGVPTCGTGCATIVTNSMDSWGAMTTSAVTSATVSWSHTLNRAPFCTVSDNSTTQFSDVSSVGTTGLTVTFAAAFTGTVYWTCGGAG